MLYFSQLEELHKNDDFLLLSLSTRPTLIHSFLVDPVYVCIRCDSSSCGTFTNLTPVLQSGSYLAVRCLLSLIHTPTQESPFVYPTRYLLPPFFLSFSPLLVLILTHKVQIWSNDSLQILKF